MLGRALFAAHYGEGVVRFLLRYPASYQQKVNSKMYRNALRAIFSELIRQDRLKVVDQFTLETPKTKDLVEKLQGLQLKKC